eukprot:2309752-Pyramimonas_sp.AAC.1
MPRARPRPDWRRQDSAMHVRARMPARDCTQSPRRSARIRPGRDPPRPARSSPPKLESPAPAGHESLAARPSSSTLSRRPRA